MLVTGPTGSSKTTTLYSSLRQARQEQAEHLDVAKTRSSITSMGSRRRRRTKIGMTFSKVLRAAPASGPGRDHGR